MSIIIEILKRNVNALGDVGWIVQKSKTIEINTVINNTTKQRARAKLEELKSTLATDEKIRVLEYHNDDEDNKNRKPCKILFEG